MSHYTPFGKWILISSQMAKRMQFSVVGLPHYTVWHLYEPSVDDIRHMEEMEQERRNQENEEKERTERAKKIKEEFTDEGSKWETDKNTMDSMVAKDEQIKKEHDGAIADKKSKDRAEEKATQVADDEEPAETKVSKVSKDDKETKRAKGASNEDTKAGKKASKDEETNMAKAAKNEKGSKEARDA